VHAHDDELDDPAAIEAGDPAGMLAAVGSAGSQVRESAGAAAKAGVPLLADTDRPRSVVVAGMGGSGLAGDVLCGVVGESGPVPVVLHRGYGLPGWVGPADLVFGVSASGFTEETLSAVAEAGRRGTRLLTVGAPESPLASVTEAAGGLHLPVESSGWQPRARLWALSVPLLVAAHALGLADVPPEVLDSTADLLDGVAARCGPDAGGSGNPAKAVARHLVGGVPVVWGSTPLAGVAARRFACQLNENAKTLAVWEAQPEASHNQVVALEGPHGGAIRLVILRDAEEDPPLARRRAACVELAESHGVAVSEVPAHGTHRLERLAGLIALADHASVYLALALGIDPTPVGPITYLKERIATAQSWETTQPSSGAPGGPQ
jgi:glucose/mannose-6-phosphate isomerase